MDRKSKYRLKNKKLGLCINCPNKPWGDRVTCKRCTLKRRARENGPQRVVRLKRLKLRNRRKSKEINLEGNEKWRVLEG